MARPVYWTEERKEKAFETIINRMCEGESVRSILKSKDLPSNRLFLEWLSKDEKLSKQYAYASEIRADVLFDEIIEIADNSQNDTVESESGERPNNEWINRSRLRVDSRKWIVSKLNSRKYGDKNETKHIFEKPIFNGINLDVQQDDSTREDS